VPVIAIDFETANEDRGSACALGLAWIEGHRVVRVEERLIRPRPGHFSPFNVQIHGITAADVADQPEFPEVLSTYFPDLTGSLVLAHNAAFDISVLRAALDRWGLRYPTFSYLCTVKIARLVWPELPSAALPVVARHVGVSFDHHQAGADAYACARVAIAAAGQLGVAGVSEIPDRIGLKVGSLFETGWQPCSSPRRCRSRSPLP
jgi:DNA polymerase-3 subunit epsilon